MAPAGPDSIPAVGGAPAAAKQIINIVRAENPASFFVSQLPAELIPGIDIGISTEPLPAEHIDLYVLPATQYTGACEELRARKLPVIAYGPAELLPLAFDCGCRDFLRDPWSISELKVRAIRHLPPRRMSFCWGVVELRRNTLLCTARYSSTLAPGPASNQNKAPGSASSAVELPPPETALLRQLLTDSENPVSRECLQYALYHTSRALHVSGAARLSQLVESRAVDVHISRLRKKFNRLAGYRLTPSPIRSIYGYGYQLIHK